MSTDKQTRATEYFSLLRHYHDSLSATLEKLGSDPRIFSFDNLLDELKQCGNYLLVMLPMLLQLMIANPNELTDMDDVAEKLADGDFDNLDIITEFDADSRARYEQLINDCVEDIVALGYFRPITDSEVKEK